MNLFDNEESRSKRSLLIEALAFTLGVVYLIYEMRQMLILGQTTFPHDHVYWGYPVFQFFSENLANGRLPLWNPFTHGGEPFYPIFIHLRLLEPVTLLTIYIGQFITNDSVLLYNWSHFNQNLVMVLGIYCILRSIAGNTFIRVSLVPILLFTSFMLTPLRQAGPIYQFVWVPFIIFFLFRITFFKDYRWHNWLIMAALIGVNWQSYYFSGTWILLLLFILGLLVFHRDILKETLKCRQAGLKFTVASIIVITMMLPNIVSFLEKNKYVFPARMIQPGYEDNQPLGGPQQFEGTSLPNKKGIVMPYKLIAYTGTFSNMWDIIQMISPDGNTHYLNNNIKPWGKPSEAFFYIGLLPWIIALLGLIAGKHSFKNLCLFLFAAFGLLLLGPAGGLHRFLYYLYPPVWFIRHTHVLILFFLTLFLYFYVLGFNHIISRFGKPLFPAEEDNRGALSVLSRVTKIDNINRIIAPFLLSGCIIFLVRQIAGLEYPETNYSFLLLLLCFAIAWVLRKDLGKKGLFTSIIASNVILVILYDPSAIDFLIKIGLIVGIPYGSFILIKKDSQITKRFRLLILLPLLFSVCLLWDLTGHLGMAYTLYRGEMHPKTYNIDTTLQKPRLIHSRSVAPETMLGSGNQSLRYLSLVFRKPSVFSPIMLKQAPANPESEKDITQEILANNSFENWGTAPKGTLLPKGFTYIQNGTGGSAKRCGYDHCIKDGRYSVELLPSSAGNSMLRFRINNIEPLKDRTIRFSAWVKSPTKTPDAVQLDIQDNTRSISVASYSNSGGWERVKVVKHVEKNTQYLIFTMNIKHLARDGAWLDDIRLYAGEKEGEFLSALTAKRWNSFMLSKNYFNLINSKIRPDAIKEMFSIGKPIFQFKHGIVEVDNDKLDPLTPETLSEDLLKEYVLINSEDIESTIKRFRADSTRNESLDPQDNTDFSYSITDYEYNSFKINVATDTEGLLYWSDGYDENWHAYINDREVPLYRANINFKAIVLPEGTSSVRFTFEHPLFKAALFAFYGAFLLSILAALAAWLYSRNKICSENSA